RAVVRFCVGLEGGEGPSEARRQAKRSLSNALRRPAVADVEESGGGVCRRSVEVDVFPANGDDLIPFETRVEQAKYQRLPSRSRRRRDDRLTLIWGER